MAVSPNAPIVVRASNEVLEVVQVFDKELKPIEIIQLDFSSSATLVNVIEQVKFLGGNKLQIKYLSGPEYDEKEQTIVLKDIH
jgi:hypothetical protein